MGACKKSLWWVLCLTLVFVGCSDSPDDEEVTEVPTGSPWSDPNSWPSGRVPEVGEDVVIEKGRQILLDVSPPPLGGLTLEGSLVFDDKDLELSARWIMVHGALRVGHPRRAYEHQATITLTGDDPREEQMGMGTRGLLVMGGKLELHGVAPNKTWTKLSSHADAGTTSLSLVDEVDWKAGDEIVVAPTDFYRVGRTERLRVASVSGGRVELESPLEKFRWGLLQYIDENGVSLTPSDSVTDKVLDERAEVGNLSRNIVVQGPDDALWKEQRFGAHVMVMANSEARMDGVEFRRVGQAGRVARYPVHWHLWSYGAPGDARGVDVEDQYVRNSSIWQSSQRCVVIHGTNGLLVQNNVCYDIRGHAMFIEDAVERRNRLEDNLVLHIHLPDEAERLVKHDNRSSGFWLTNPDNVIRGNVVADSEGIGFWLAFPGAPLGNSKSVPVEPSFLRFGEFSGNVAHSNREMGMMFDDVPTNDAGDVSGHSYTPTATGTSGSNEPAPYKLSGMVLYKHEALWQNESVSFWNRTRYGHFEDFITADFNGTAFAGASVCWITRALVVGYSLNDENEPELTEGVSLVRSGAARVGAASYHSDCEIADNVFVNLPAIPGKPSGAFGTSDYYITGVDKGLIHNPRNRLVNAHPGFRSASPNTLPVGGGRENYSLAGALWDPHGYWGPEGNYWVYDMPFLTDGTDCSAPLAPHGNDRSCAGPYYGVISFRLNGEDPFSSPDRTRPIRVTREDNGAEWFIDDGDCTPVLGTMRDFSAVRGGTYRVEFPAGQTPGDGPDGTPGNTRECSAMSGATPPPQQIRFGVSNLFEDNDTFVIGFPFDADSSTPVVVQSALGAWDEVRTWGSWAAYESGDPNWQNAERGEFWRPLTPAASLDAVRESDGDRYWLDAARDLIWIRVARRGISEVDASFNPIHALYQTLTYSVTAN